MQTLNRASHWLIVALAFTIPMQVAVNNLVLALLLLAALPVFGRSLLGEIGRNPVARTALALFCLLLLGTLWGETRWGAAMGILGKYMDLALIPLFMLLLRDPVARERSLTAFFGIMIVALALSWAIGLHLLPLNDAVRVLVGPATLVDNPSVFHGHITQGMLTSYVCFLFALRARESSGRTRMLLVALSVLAGANVLFMLQGRTGYLVLFTLLGWLGWCGFSEKLRRRGRTLGWKHALAALLTPLFLMAAVWQAAPRFQERVVEAVNEVRAWQPGNSHETSSMGRRLDFYSNTLHLIAERPLSGYGTGGFGAAFTRQTAGTSVLPTNNPHNEYLMLGVQVGLFGPLLLVLLFAVQWRAASRLPAFERDAGRGLVLAYSLTCLLNSMLLDHTEGLFFAFMTAWMFAPLVRKA